MYFHLFTKKWKWSDGQYAHSGIRVRSKLRKSDKFEKRTLFLKNNTPDLKADSPQHIKKHNKIDNSQMRCKCHTRYKSNNDE